jgi:SAM-dependent methyltransferase
MTTYGRPVTLKDSMGPDRREQASSFGPAAELYDSARPIYPTDAVAWAFETLGVGRWRVADIGAGTGIMTRVLLKLGLDVVAVEPDELMRQRLMATTPAAEAVRGAAESLPFADATLDAAIAAQSYHWFDHDRAHSELARAIRPGGVFAAIWNERDESVPWVSEFSRIVEGDRGYGHADHDLDFGDEFTPVQEGIFRHVSSQTPAGLVSLLRSRSYYLTASPDRRAALDSGVRALAEHHPDLSGQAEFALPYVVRVFRASRR